MTPVIPYSISSVSLIPGTVFATRRNYNSTRLALSRNITLNSACPPSLSLPRLPAFRLLPPYWRVHLVSATGADVAVEVEEPGASVSGEDDSGEVEAEVKSDATPGQGQSKRPRAGKKSEMPPVKNEELVVGAAFTGIVRSIQPFGAFVDFGAFTDGLVHVSQLSDNFVKEVGNVVSVGQEVKVRLLEANMETGRISLSMRSGEDSGKGQQQRRESSPGGGGDKSGGPGRRNASNQGQKRGEAKKFSKFVKGQDLEGTVKNMNRGGAFISLPEGEEGYLPITEELDDGFGTMMGETTLEVGQEISIRVLRISRGQVTLTMKKEENIPRSDVRVNSGVVHTATNPFLLAFRQNKEIATFLDEREKVETVPKQSAEPQEPEKEVVIEPVTSDELVKTDEATPVEAIAQQEASEESKKETETSIPTTIEETEASSEVLNAEESDVQTTEDTEASTEALIEEDGDVKTTVETEASTEALIAEDSDVRTPAEIEASSEVVNAEESVSVDESLVEEVSSADVVESEEKSDSAIPEPADQVVSATKDITEQEAEAAAIKDKVPVETPSPAETVESPSTEIESEAPVAVALNSDEPQESPSSEAAKATISPALVKQLREETGAGMMDCKRALSETEGDIVKAQEYLRKKGLASAEKKASRATAEGRVGSYIHDGRIGVLVEVNCETDFVSRGDIFKELVDDLAMQVAACPQVRYLVPEDVPEEILNKEREIEMQKEDLMSKPEQMRSKIVDGRIKKRLDELALLEQPYIKNDKVLIKDWVKQTIATIGENMKVKRFVRYNLGEGLEKKSQDFAAEVAAQTSAKPAPKPQPETTEEAKETVEKPTVTVSAALVKELREETGAGMMDCKKALSETGGDLEKAQEYLRKKGLSSADKKSSRLAAEGRIGSYIHDSRIGVLIEVNCETDFVGRSEKFKELVNDLAMQVVACPQVQFVSVEEVSEEIVRKEKELEMQREDLQSKPENIREKIVEGRVNKRLGELALLEQPFIKDDSVLIKDLVKQTVSALGENIKVRRFARFTLGETVGE